METFEIDDSFCAGVSRLRSNASADPVQAQRDSPTEQSRFRPICFDFQASEPNAINGGWEPRNNRTTISNPVASISGIIVRMDMLVTPCSVLTPCSSTQPTSNVSSSVQTPYHIPCLERLDRLLNLAAMASPYQTYPGILTTVYDGNTTAHAMRCPSYVNPDHLSFLVQKCTKVTDLLDW